MPPTPTRPSTMFELICVRLRLTEWRKSHHNPLPSAPSSSGQRQAGETGRGTMAYSRIFNCGVLAAAALAWIAAVPASKPAEAVPNYDGLWSVVIVTELGLCDRAYRARSASAKAPWLNAGSGAVQHHRQGRQERRRDCQCQSGRQERDRHRPSRRARPAAAPGAAATCACTSGKPSAAADDIRRL